MIVNRNWILNQLRMVLQGIQDMLHRVAPGRDRTRPRQSEHLNMDDKEDSEKNTGTKIRSLNHKR